MKHGLKHGRDFWLKIGDKSIGVKNVITYKYKAIYHNPDITMQFHLFSEVGEVYQIWFAAELAKRGLQIKTVEIDHAPWVVDVAEKVA